MMLKLKPDWEMSQKRFQAWWECRVIDRPLVLTWAPRETPLYAIEPPPAPATPEESWTDPEYRVRAFEAQAARTYYGGDAFPYFDSNIGPGSLSLFLGAQPGFDWGTVWYHKCIDDITTAELPEFDAANPWWQRSLELLRVGQTLKGKALTSFPDLVEGIDILASLVGATETLMAMIDSPEHVHRFLDRLGELYFRFYDEMEAIIRDEDGGTCFSAFQIWGLGKTAKLQCDFSAMIGPAMFDEFVAPYLAAQADRLDNVIYHLDGPECICHVDSLLRIPGINAIQWTPGSGKEPLGDDRWMPMYRKIREGGKGLVLFGLTPAECEKLVRELGPEGLLLGSWVGSQREADELVAASFNWKKGVGV